MGASLNLDEKGNIENKLNLIKNKRHLNQIKSIIHSFYQENLSCIKLNLNYMKYEDIKPFDNINDALNSYNNLTYGKAVKFIKPSHQSDWFYTSLRTLSVVKILKTIEQNQYQISKLYHIKYELKLFWDCKTVQIKEDKSNYSIVITQGAGLIPTKSKALYNLFEDLYNEMRRSLPSEKLEYNMKYINSYLNTTNGK